MKCDTQKCNRISLIVLLSEREEGVRGGVLRTDKEFAVHGEILEGVMVSACVYCLAWPLCGGGLNFKVCMCACVCVGRLIIFRAAKADRVGTGSAEGEAGG